jgi:hypothetical protein
MCRMAKIAGGTCHEMLKSRLQSQYWTRPSSARLVQQAAVLFKAVPRLVRSSSIETVTTRSDCHELFRVAFPAAD